MNVPGIAKLDSRILKGDYVAVMTLKGELIMTGIAQMNANEMEKKSDGIAVKPERVFMAPVIQP